MSGASDAGAFRVTLRRPGEQSAKLTAALRRFMIAKYPVDASRITVRRGAPAPPIADRPDT
jgi:hypothetical protein